MKRITKTTLFIFLLSLSSFAQAQFFSDLALNDSSARPTNEKYGLRFNSIAFFKNNEYFHPLVEGYTLPGFMVQPRFFYEAGEKFSLEAGIHLSQISGKKDLNSVDPLFRATYNVTPSFSVLLGWIKGTTHHQLIEPLFQWERMYTNPLEYGVQFLVNRDKFKLDTWIDWEKYIEFNDPFQEELTFGTTSKVLLLKKNNLELWLPVQATIKHKGGQIISIDVPLTTIANWASGVNVSLTQPSGVVKRILFDFYYVGYKELSPTKQQRYEEGFGLYPVLSANISMFQASLGYWYGHQFIATKGEPLFLSVSATHPEVAYKDRNVVTFKTSFFKPIYKEINFGAYFESYYDTNQSQMDYDYGISLTASADILFGRK
jgi:hypothetical protein